MEPADAEERELSEPEEEVAEANVELAPDVNDAVLLALLVMLPDTELWVAEASEEAELVLEAALDDDDDDELELLSKTAWMRISWHWAPIDSS